MANLVEVFAAAWDALHPAGVMFVNLADTFMATGTSFVGGGGGQLAGSASWNAWRECKKSGKPGARFQRASGLPNATWKPKDEVPVTDLFRLAMMSWGWRRGKRIIWRKANGIPEAVRDRPTRGHECVFMFVKDSADYFYDWLGDPVRTAESSIPRAARGRNPDNKYAADGGDAKLTGSVGLSAAKDNAKARHANEPKANVPGQGVQSMALRDVPLEFANLRDVWDFPTAQNGENHFAAFPQQLPARCIRLATSAGGHCAGCGRGFRRQIRIDENTIPRRVITTGWKPDCRCNAGEPVRALVFDPFMGSGTTAAAAISLGRDYAGADLSAEYCEMAKRRAGLF